MPSNKLLIYFQESEALARTLSEQSGIKALPIEILQYSFGEFSLRLPPLAPKADVFFLIQNNGNPSDVLIRVLMTLDILDNHDPERVNLIIPYLPFSRQDRKKEDHRALASRVVAKMLNTSFISNIFTFDLHNDVITDYFKMPVYNLTMLDAFISYFQSLKLDNVAIVAPDYGRFNAAKYVASAFNDASFILINKIRDSEGIVEILGVEGDPKGKKALIIEDIIDTGNTLERGVSALLEHGVSEVYVAATHGVFSGDALEKIKALGVKKVVVTNTILQQSNDPLLEVLSIENQLLSILND